ncbi:MAG: ribose 5-phosphate isomerase B [Oscillospiraceae bacterium]|nr:ribose 5-phosphate isomerase B [Oscillospiraceae bacterium]
MIALACDHGGFELMQDVKKHLDSAGYEYKDFGTFSSESCDYPVIAAPAAEAISAGNCDKGIFICGTGIGMSIAANKTCGIRAALCTDCYMAEMTRSHNDANVLVLGGRVTKPDVGIKIVETFLTTDFSNEEKHCRRVAMLNQLDAART